MCKVPLTWLDDPRPQNAVQPTRRCQCVPVLRGTAAVLHHLPAVWGPCVSWLLPARDMLFVLVFLRSIHFTRKVHHSTDTVAALNYTALIARHLLWLHTGTFAALLSVQHRWPVTTQQWYPCNTATQHWYPWICNDHTTLMFLYSKLTLLQMCCPGVCRLCAARQLGSLHTFSFADWIPSGKLGL